MIDFFFQRLFFRIRIKIQESLEIIINQLKHALDLMNDKQTDIKTDHVQIQTIPEINSAVHPSKIHQHHHIQLHNQNLANHHHHHQHQIGFQHLHQPHNIMHRSCQPTNNLGQPQPVQFINQSHHPCQHTSQQNSTVVNDNQAKSNKNLSILRFMCFF